MCRKIPGHVPAISRKHRGQFPDNSRTNPGIVPDTSRKFHGTFPRNLSGQFPGRLPEFFRKCCRIFPGRFLDIFRKCPGTFPENSRTCPGHFPEIYLSWSFSRMDFPGYIENVNEAEQITQCREAILYYLALVP